MKTLKVQELAEKAAEGQLLATKAMYPASDPQAISVRKALDLIGGCQTRRKDCPHPGQCADYSCTGACVD